MRNTPVDVKNIETKLEAVNLEAARLKKIAEHYVELLELSDTDLVSKLKPVRKKRTTWNITKEKLHKMYNVAKLSVKQIAEKEDVTTNTVYGRLREWNLLAQKLPTKKKLSKKSKK